MRTVTALCLALPAGDRIALLSRALFRALRVQDRALDHARVLAEILRQHDFDADHLLARTHEPAVEQALVNQTSHAVAAGVFGAPTVIVEQARDDRREDRLVDHLVWGMDRLTLVESAARGWRPRAG